MSQNQPTACTQFDLMMQIASSKATPILEPPEKNDRSHNASIEMERPGIVETFGGKNFYEEKRQNPKDLNKERFKALQKLWIAVTKYIASQAEKGRVVDLPFAGKFKKVNDVPESATAYSELKNMYAFQPQLDFVSSGFFKLGENKYNISPFSKGAIAFQTNVVTVSLTSIAAVCGLDREAVATGVKQILAKFVS